jgi:hypothetical protein
MTSRRMRWAEHEARMGKMRNAYKSLVEKPEGRNHSKDVRIILKWILGKSVFTVWVGFRIKTGSGLF